MFDDASHLTVHGFAFKTSLSLSMMMIQRKSPLEHFCSRDTFIQGEGTLFLHSEDTLALKK